MKRPPDWIIVCAMTLAFSVSMACSTAKNRETLPGHCLDGERGVKLVMTKDVRVIGYCLDGDLIKLKDLGD